MSKSFFIVSVGVLICFFSLHQNSYAQMQSEESGKSRFQQRREFGFHAGGFLPYGIYGVRDQYPMWGGRYGHPFRIWRLEWGGYFTSAKGVRLYNGSVSWTFDLDIYDVKLLPFVGGDVYYYSGKTNIRTLPFVITYGGHIGLSPYFVINNMWAMRADFKYNFSPGNSLYAGIGFAYSWAGSTDQQEDQK